MNHLWIKKGLKDVCYKCGVVKKTFETDKGRVYKYSLNGKTFSEIEPKCNKV